MPLAYRLSVIEPGAPSTAEHRFTFEDERAAWDAYVRAVQAGLIAWAERVEQRETVAPQG